MSMTTLVGLPAVEARRLVRWTLLHGVVQAGAAVGAHTHDPYSEFMTQSRYRADPFPFYESVRGRGTVVPGRIATVSVSHRVCLELLRGEDWHSRPDEAALPWPLRRLTAWGRDEQALGATDPPSMLVLDPPEHGRYRRLVGKVFTPRAVEALRPRVQAVADELLDRLSDRGVVDLVDTYASQLPVAVICELLGVPHREHDRVRQFGREAAPALDIGIGYGRYRSVDTAIRRFQAWLAGHLRQLRHTPGEDLLSRLVHLEDEDGQRLTDIELQVTALLLLAAGYETTTNLLGSGTVLLLEHPDQREVLVGDPSLWPGAVEEMLRFEGPVQLTGRFATRDTELAGHRLKQGTLMLAYVAGANRDPEVFADPATFDVRRANARDHLAFSGGRHYCLGAGLARLEAEVGLRTLFQHFPHLALAGPGRRTTTRLLRGWTHLPVQPAPKLGARP